MEIKIAELRSKSKAKVSTAGIRVRHETKKRVLQEVAKANKKDFGKRVRVEDLVALAIGLLEPKHVAELQEKSLSHADRLEQQYRAYNLKNGPISKDAYLGMRLSGEISVSEG